MTINKAAIEGIFKASVAQVSPLPCGFGLRVDLAKYTDMGALFRRDNDLTPHSNFSIFGLVQQHGLVVLSNVCISGHIDGTLNLTGRKVEQFEGVFDDLFKKLRRVCGRKQQNLPISLGGLKDDFWHRDILPSISEKTITILDNPEGQERKAPTLWARARDVKKATRDLASDLAFANKVPPSMRINLLEQIRLMSQPDYGFTPQDRKWFMDRFGHPDLTTPVTALIDPQNVYTHQWTGAPEITLHYNNGNLLHARPPSGDPYSALRGFTLVRGHDKSPSRVHFPRVQHADEGKEAPRGIMIESDFSL